MAVLDTPHAPASGCFGVDDQTMLLKLATGQRQRIRYIENRHGDCVE